MANLPVVLRVLTISFHICTLKCAKKIKKIVYDRFLLRNRRLDSFNFNAIRALVIYRVYIYALDTFTCPRHYHI